MADTHTSTQAQIQGDYLSYSSCTNMPNVNELQLFLEATEVSMIKF